MIIQAAIDIIELNKAIDVAGQAIEAGVDWIEVGYPLIKFQGLENTLNLFRKTFPDTYLLADCSIIAGSKRYINKAYNEKFNNITVSSLIPDYSTKEAIEYSKTLDGFDITVDLFNHKDPVAKTLWAESLGADYVMVHFGLDQIRNESFEGALNTLTQVCKASTVPISFATYSIEQAVQAVKAGAKVLVQGYPFLETENPKANFKEYVDAVRSL